MNKTTEIKCPICNEIQHEDIIDLTEGGDLVGQFKNECDFCLKLFTVEFEFVPYVKTY